MKIKNFVKICAISLFLLCLMPGLARAQAPRGTSLGTSFTYQGQLKSSDAPYSGTCDFTFGLYDAQTEGTQIGTLTLPNINIDGGYFTVQLDYGPDAFQGDNRWLAIAVRCPAGVGSYIPLSPRQFLSAAPYALFAKTATQADSVPWTGISGMPAGFSDGVDDDTTYTAGSGLTLTSTSFSVDTSTIQARVGGVCGSGYAIRQVYADGTVLCEPVAGGAGDITAVTAGTGLTGGGTSGDVTLSVNPTYVQRRVSSSCTAGSAIRAISDDGTVTCETDDNTTYTAGTGLSLADSTFSANTTYLQRRVTGGCDSGSAISEINVDGTVVCEPVAGGAGDITAVTAGTGLTGGGVSGDVTLSINPTYVQRRVSSSCTAGSAIRAIADDGTVTCETDDNTTYAAGTGLSITGTTFSVDTSSIQARVSDACGTGYAIRAIDINGVVTCEPVSGGSVGWSLTGNAGTTAGTNYLGTSDNQPLEIKVNDTRVFRFEPNSTSPNLIGGYWGNWLLPNMHGATISGGGTETLENRVTDIFGTVGGGGGNQAGNNVNDYTDSMGATVSGGAQNTASGQFSVVGGGVSNLAGNAAAVGGGISNTASGLGTVIGGGESNTASYDYAAVGGGYGNIASSNAATVSGGNANTASGDFATASGGDDNIASGGYTAISGGKYNQAIADFTAIGGGWYNIASSKYTTIAGGGPSDETNFETTHNRATDNYCTVGGGGGNLSGNDNEITNDATYDTVSGGKNNAASGYYSTVSGGALNEARSGASTIGGGYDNTASGEFGSTVSGGALNTASGAYASIGGGYLNQASATYTTISGGGPSEPSSNPNNTNNIATDDYCTVGGGGGNQAGDNAGTITDATYATVSGGYQNTAGGTYTTVAGGSQNTNSGYASSIGGGILNEITGGYATIAGGHDNTVSMGMSTIAGGEYNTVSGGYAFIGGGYLNNASENYAAIGGGNNNTADGVFGTIPGGYLNNASGWYSFAAGYRAQANEDGCFVWGDATTDRPVTCDTPNRWVARASGGVYFFTNSYLGAGTYLDAGGTAWNIYSNREFKENFNPVDSVALLASLAKYPITTWNYKAQDESIIHIGMMADEFNSLIEGLGGEGEDYINSMDAVGVALAAAQGLYAENQELKARVDDLEARMTALEEMVVNGNVQKGQAKYPSPWLFGLGLLVIGGAYVIRRRPGGGL